MSANLRLASKWVAAVVGGTIVSAAPNDEFSGVSIDSRTVRRGELYFGIRGDRFDGADFAAAAAAGGATGVVVPRGRAAASALSNVVAIEVDDPTAALQALAHATRKAAGTKVVAITGSAGKTTTKEVTAEFLGTTYRVIRNRGNLNNHIGLPLSLMELTERPDIAVVELGMNHAGEISTLVRIAEPDVRVWTNVGEAHLGFFASIDAIADAKAEILEGATSETVLVANADDDRVARHAKRFAGRVVTFGMDRTADVRASHIVDRGVGGTTARVATPRGECTMSTPLIGRGNLANVLAATAVAIHFDVPLEKIVARAASLKPAQHRGDVARLARGVIVVDDSYNANPTATRRALDVLRSTQTRGRRVAVLGEMLELGDHATTLHEEVGRAAANGIDALLAVGGPPAHALADAAVSAGMPRTSVHYFTNSDEAATVIRDYVHDGDLVLVKGSRGVRTDLVVDRLKAEFA